MGKEEALAIIKKYYDEESDAYKALVAHGDAVAKKVREILARNPNLDVDSNFLEEAAYLHDIGIIKVNAEKIGCHGEAEYLQHGLFGKEILEKEGLPQDARIAERHLGVGLMKEEIIKKSLPLPAIDMLPETLEEEIITFADLFYSKIPGRMHLENEKGRIKAYLAQFGERHQTVFDKWCEKWKE